MTTQVPLTKKGDKDKYTQPIDHRVPPRFKNRDAIEARKREKQKAPLWLKIAGGLSLGSILIFLFALLTTWAFVAYLGAWVLENLL